MDDTSDIVITFHPGGEVVVPLVTVEEAVSLCRELMQAGHHILRIERGAEIWEADRLRALIGEDPLSDGPHAGTA